MKFNLTGYVHAKLCDEWDTPDHMGHIFSFWRHEDMKSVGYIKVGTYDVEVEIPDDWNPIPENIALLRDKQQKIRAEAEGKCTLIDDQIGKLSCLEFKQDVTREEKEPE